MSEPLILACIWALGAPVFFRCWAKFLITTADVRRREAIRDAAILAIIWPLVLLGYLILGIGKLLVAGLPVSERERAEEIAALERELLDEPDEGENEPEEPMATLVREALQEAPQPDLTCSRCGCPVVPGRRGHVHVPTLGGPSACSFAVVLVHPKAQILTGDEPVAIPWYFTPEDSLGREAVRRRTEVALSRGMSQREVADLPRDAKYVSRLEFHRALHMGGFKSCTKCHPTGEHIPPEWL